MLDLAAWFLAAWHLVVSCPAVMPPLVALFPVAWLPAVMPPLVASFLAAMPPLASAAVQFLGSLVNPAPRLEAYRCPETIPAGP